VIVKRSESDLPTVYFRGTPQALDCLVAIPHREVGASPRISLDDRALSLRLQGIFAFDVGGKASRLQLSLSDSTPPGNYMGSVEMGGKSFSAEIRVEPYAHLALSPRQLILAAHAGEKQHANLSLANTGNVPCEIGSTYLFGLYDVHGAERGIGAAFRQTESTGEKRVERLLEELASGHAGTVRVQVEEGHGSIAPGEVRNLRLHLHFPAKLEVGHTYTGTLAMENLRYYVKVRAVAQK
jgi:hypothetical protein